MGFDLDGRHSRTAVRAREVTRMGVAYSRRTSIVVEWDGGRVAMHRVLGNARLMDRACQD